MKKIGMFLVLVMLFFVTTGCENNKLKGYTSISYNEFVAKKENKDTFPLVIGSSTCSACANYEVIMNQFIENNQTEVFYIDLSGVTEEEYNKLRAEVTFDSTPTTVFYNAGKATSFYNRLVGSADINQLKNFMKENNYIG